MTFESITHFLSKEPHKDNRVPNEQFLTLKDINFSPSVEPDNRRARRNRLAALSTHSEPLKKAA